MTNKDIYLNNSIQTLISISEYLKLPLTQINNHVELSEIGAINSNKDIADIASFGIELIDNYILGMKMNANKNMINNDIYSVSSIFYDSAHILNKLARQYDVDIHFNINKNLSPIITDKKAIQGALVSLGGAIIEFVSNSDNKYITLATHKCRYGLVAGIYANDLEIGRKVLQQGIKLQSNAHRPFPELSHTNSSGVFVAKQILESMDMKLLASKHQKLRGIGMLLNSSTQMSLV